MDELESRLSEGLARHARDLPSYRGDLVAVRRRGRHRRWAARGAGAVGALALLGGGVALYDQLDNEPPESVATNDGGPAQQVAIAPTPTPAPEPTPVVIDPEPPPIPLPVSSDDPDDASLLVATGWGVGLLNHTGSLFAPVVCCTADEAPWYERPNVGAVAVRDDLRGGLLTASDTALSWTPAPVLGTASPALLATAGSPDAFSTWIDLWDVAELDGEVRVLYSTVEILDDDATTSTSTLWSLALDAEKGSALGQPVALDTATWSAETGDLDDRYYYDGGAWLPNGAAMTLRSAGQGACSWIEFSNPSGPVGPAVSPYPRPGPVCDRPSLAAATIDDTGTHLAISEGYLEGEPALVVFELVTGVEVARFPLAPADDGRGWWTEIDMDGDKVLVSRGAGMERTNWATLDESLILDIESGQSAHLQYYGAPAFPREAVSTTELTALSPDSPERFLLPATPQPAPSPGADDEPEPTASDDPDPGPTPTPIPADPPLEDRARVPVGRQANIVAADAFVGTSGCAPKPIDVCVGQQFDEAKAALDAAFPAGERTDDPATFLEGEPHPEGTHVWLDETRRVTLEHVDGVVRRVSVSPASDATVAALADGAPTVGEILRALGPPAEIFQGGGEGVDVLVLTYDTDAALVSYAYVEFWGGETSRLSDPGGPLKKVPRDYDDLPLISYTAEPAG